MTTTSPKSERLLELTRVSIQLQQVGLHEDALEILEKVLRLDPGYSAAYLVRGLSLQAINNTVDAEVAFRKALKLEHGNDQALKSLGLLLVSIKKYEEGIDYLSRYHKKHSDDIVTLKSLVSAYTALERSKDVKNVLERSWQTTYDVDLGIQYARFLLSQGNNELALDVISQVVEKSSTPRTLTEQSLVLVVLEKYALAIEKLEQALEQDPRFDRALRGLSFCYTKLGQIEEAIEAADSALVINNKHYRNWQAKGDALLALGEFDDALFTAQTAIDLIDLRTDPEAEPVLDVLYLQKFNAYLGLNKTDDALKELEHAREILPREIRFYVYPAQLILGLGNAAGAEKMLRLAKKAGLLDQFPGNLRLKILLETGQYKKVWEWIDPIMNEEFVEMLIGVGYQYYINHDGDISRNIFEHLLGIYPGNPQLAIYLAFILTGYGEHKQAETLLLQALKSKIPDIEPLAKCNLGFIYLVTNKLDQAKTCFQWALANASASDEAIARVGFWHNQDSELCCAPYPTQSLPLKLVANANLVAVYLQENNIKEAEKIINKIVKQYQNLSLSYQLIGNLHFVKDNTQLARENWEKALLLSADDVEKSMINDWLDNLLGATNLKN